MSEKLKFRVRLHPVSPVHIGIGTQTLARSGFHYHEQTQRLYPLRQRAIAEALLDAYGHEANVAAVVRRALETDTLPPKVAQAIRAPGSRLALREVTVHPAARNLLREGLKEVITLASGVPYIPGSTLKGALRTVWLDWLLSGQGGRDAARRFLAQDAEYRRKAFADDPFIERLTIAGSLTGVSGRLQAQNRDVFRAVQVSDLLPRLSGPTALTGAFPVLALSYQVNGYARPADGGRAAAQAWECLRPGAKVPYEGDVTIDLALLERLRLDGPGQRLVRALADPRAWRDVLHDYGVRVFAAEQRHYERLDRLPQRSRGVNLEPLLDWMDDPANVDDTRLLPLGMGTGLLSKSLLGVEAEPAGEDGAEPTLLGDTPRGQSTALRDVLKLGKPTSGYQDNQVRPKSRRVAGKFEGRDPSGMKADWPLGWTHLDLEGP